MASYVLTIVGYPASDTTGTFEWGVAGAKGQVLTAGCATISGSGTAAALAIERMPYHALFAGFQALLAENYVSALTIAPRRRSSRSCGQTTMLKILTFSDCGSWRSNSSIKCGGAHAARAGGRSVTICRGDRAGSTCCQALSSATAISRNHAL